MAEHETGSALENGRGACFSGGADDSGISTGSGADDSGISTGNGTDSFPHGGGPALCPVCGEPAEGFGSFPIAEGLLCGTCAGKLSEWFPCRPTTTAAEIRQQLSYREENRTAAGTFHTSKILWSQPCVALDTQNGAFQISRQQGRSANPDILSFRQILGCQVEIAEQRRELFRAGREHYRPRRYEYRFEIFLRVLVDHPWFHEMRFRLHDRPIVVSDRMVQASTAGKVVKSPEYQRYRRAGEEICAALRKAMEQGRETAKQAEADSEAAGETAGESATGADTVDCGGTNTELSPSA